MAIATSGFLTGVGELLLAGLLAEIMSVLGAIASIASAIIALPGAWIAQDKVARFNGHCRGYCWLPRGQSAKDGGGAVMKLTRR
jgi:hypothetical protein